VELQINGSGFTVPHHATIADADGSLGYRLGAVELIVGGRFFHFKTSTQNAEYFKTTLQGGYAGLRFYPSMISVPCLFCKGRNTTATNAPADTTSSSPGNETTTSTTKGSSTSSSTKPPGAYVHRFTAGPILSVEGLSLLSGGTNTVTNSSTVTTMYQTTSKSSRIGYGLITQVAVTDHFAVAIAGILRRIGYTFDTTVTTSKPTVVSGVVTTVTTSTINHEDTRANLIDIPATVRFYSKSRHEPGSRWFVEGGAAWRKTESIRTSMSFTDASSVLSCCTTTPAQPAHASVFGIVAGAGVQVMDAFGIKVVPEVRYTRWMNPVFQAFTTKTQQNEITAGFSITF
jgi:hypothetical protein